MFWFKQNPKFIPSLVAFCGKDMKKAEPNKTGLCGKQYTCQANLLW
jgi:hypothetical protein